MKTFTRCWCCSELKMIDLENSDERLCEECIAEMDAREDAGSDVAFVGFDLKLIDLSKGEGTRDE